jgi:ADP-ribose pyrophosphatase YjhB (NUDIX family)
MTPVCDHTSVGILVRRDGQLLLIERKRPPIGWAPPAGHVDDQESYEAAARSELFEEVGLRAISLTLIAEGRRDNPCRRQGGTWHNWKIYQADAQGDPKPSEQEVKRLHWCTRDELETLAARTRLFLEKKLSEPDWKSQPGLEPIWLEWLQLLGVVGTEYTKSRKRNG